MKVWRKKFKQLKKRLTEREPFFASNERYTEQWQIKREKSVYISKSNLRDRWHEKQKRCMDKNWSPSAGRQKKSNVNRQPVLDWKGWSTRGFLKNIMRYNDKKRSKLSIPPLSEGETKAGNGKKSKNLNFLGKIFIFRVYTKRWPFFSA